jgi:translation initiation factor IF-3
MERIINEQIVATEVMLIDQNGAKVGVVPKRKALSMADEAGLDLVQMSNNSDIPVCKILNNSKLEYDEKKKQKQNKNLNPEKFKEIKFKTAISEHDLGTKINHINEFLSKGFRIQIAVQIINRQINNSKIARELLDGVFGKLTNPYKVVSSPEIRGNFYSSVICSDKKETRKH